jgi:hypothetical protein
MFTFHEAFWATVGAAAQMIALASVISTTDVISIEEAFRFPDRTIRQLHQDSPSAV